MLSISAKPDLVIYLQSSVDRLMQNIRIRGRDFERDLSEAYLREVSEAYNHYFYHYTQTPLLIINSTEIDFVGNPDHLAYIEEQIFEKPIRAYTQLHIAP